MNVQKRNPKGKIRSHTVQKRVIAARIPYSSIPTKSTLIPAHHDRGAGMTRVEGRWVEERDGGGGGEEIGEGGI